MANTHENLTSLFTDIADAIRSKTGGSAPIVADQFPEAIEGISSGGGADDGWPVAFPVGDGNTHIWIEITNERTSPKLGLNLHGTAVVDWGDGSEPDTITGTNYATTTTPHHEYGKSGKYVISISIDGMARIAGARGVPNAGSRLCFYTDEELYINATYHLHVKKVEAGNGIVMFGSSACYGLHSMTDVLITKGATFGSSAFGRCYSILRYDFTQYESVPSLPATSVFELNPPDYKILVPAALVDEWKAATNWSTYADYIVGV